MPVYEFSCEDCGKKFDIVATLAEKEAGLNPACPNCGGGKVRQIFGRFTVLGGGKTEMEFDEGDFGAGDYDEQGLGEDDFDYEGLEDEGDFGADEDIDAEQ